MKIIKTENLVRKYGSKKALDGINLEVEKGKIVGILGPNGSGKTTLIKILTGLLRPTSGSVRIDDKEIGIETKKIVSYLPDRNFLYDWMNIGDAGDFYNDFYDDFEEEKFNQLLTFMHLDRTMKVPELSKGMHEKLNLALVLSRNAELYILDEPIAGVDPVARDQILDAIINNYREDSAMLITTHLVRDMENIFEDVVFLKEGNIVLEGNAEELRVEYGNQIDGIYKEIFGE